jgi:hypothetical protein
MWRRAKWIGHISCKNCLFKYVTKGKYKKIEKGREDEKEEASCYLMTLRKRQVTGN